jgi:hypothetical protein
MEVFLERPSELPLAIWKLFFAGEKVFYKNQELRTKYVNLKSGGTIKKIQVGEYLYLEQNPNSGSRYAAMSKQGHNILWIIHQPTNKYIGKVVDEKVEKL